MQFQGVRHGIFRYKMCAAGKKMRFQAATKEILHYKICAAGENSAVSERYKEDFTLQNERHRRFFAVSGF